MKIFKIKVVSAEFGERVYWENYDSFERAKSDASNLANCGKYAHVFIISYEMVEQSVTEVASKPLYKMF